MDKLSKLLHRYSKRPESRFWIGERPDVRDGQLITAILANIGYPTTSYPFDAAELKEQGCSSAARILAFSATRSLAYEMQRAPSAGAQQEALDAIRELDGAAKFFSNSDWGNESSQMSWTPLSSATFDAGVIGYDASSAFIFWVEEED